MTTPPATSVTVLTVTAATRVFVILGGRKRAIRCMQILPTWTEERGFRLWLLARPTGDHDAWRIIASLWARDAAPGKTVAAVVAYCPMSLEDFTRMSLCVTEKTPRWSSDSTAAIGRWPRNASLSGRARRR